MFVGKLGVVRVHRAPVGEGRELFGLSLRGGWDVLRDIRQWRQLRRGRMTTNFAEAGTFMNWKMRTGLPRPCARRASR